MAETEQDTAAHTANPLTSVPIEIVVAVGRARPSIRNLVGMGQNSVLELDRRVDDPVELMVGDKVIARGTLEEREGDPNGGLCVRLTEIVDLKGSLT